MDLQFDAVIIGSGAGGAPIAHTLVAAGRTVLVLEKGPLLRPQADAPNQISPFKRDELLSTGAEKILTLGGVANQGASYYSSHIEPDLNDEPHVYRRADGTDAATIEGYTAQAVGGGTQLYGGVSLRFTARDLTLASFNAGRTLLADPRGEVAKAARDWPIGYDELEPYYAKAERLIGINGERRNQLKPFSADEYQKPLPPNPISAHIVRGLEALGMSYYRTPLAVITQDHAPSGRKMPASSPKTAYVNRYGDPLGLKSNTWVALLRPISHQPNFKLMENCVVTHLGSDGGGKIDQVHFIDVAGRRRSAKGRIVVVACSAIETVRLLKLSAAIDENLARRLGFNGLLGAYFLTHCFGGASGLVPPSERYDKSLTLDSDYATDHCHTDEFLREHGLWAGSVIYNNTSDRALPLALARNYASRDLDSVWQGFMQASELVGEGLEHLLDQSVGRGLSITFMSNQVPQLTNRVELHPSVTDKWGRPVAYIIKNWHPHDIALIKTMARICRNVLYRGGVRDDLGYGGVYGSDDLARFANHILGGARFGTREDDSVLDRDCRAWRLDNLYVADGSFMPTSGGANPTLTIQANAFRVADLLLRRI